MTALATQGSTAIIERTEIRRTEITTFSAVLAPKPLVLAIAFRTARF